MDPTYTNSTNYEMKYQFSFITCVFFFFFQGSNFLLTLPLNIYLMFLFARTGVLDESMFFTLNQCVSEILTELSAPLQLLCLSAHNICPLKLLGFSIGIFYFAHPLFQCCICLEHYLAVVYPVIFLKFKPIRYKLAFSTVIWTCVISLCFAVMLTFPRVPYTIFGGLYITILVVELVCCISILKVLKQPGPGHREMGKEEIRKKNIKEKAFKVVFVSLLMFLIQSAPVGIVLSLRDTLFESTFNFAICICVAINIVARFTQVAFFVHKVGKLTCPRCV